MSRDSVHAERRDDCKPRKHYRTERPPDFAGAERMSSAKRKQFDDRSRPYLCMLAWPNLLHPLKRGQYGDCRSDSTVAVDQSCTEQSGSDDCGPVLFFHSK